MGTAILVRHGETAWNNENRAQGWAPTTLTERGRRQSEALAEHLAFEYDIDRVVSSDIRRAKETTRILGEVVDAPIDYDRAWREQDLGTLQGFLAATLERQFPEYAVAEAGRTSSKRTPESGESFDGMVERVLDTWRSIVQDVGDETHLVVAHGGPIRVVLGDVMGLSVEEGVERLQQDNCAINVIDVESDEVTVQTENDTEFLRK